MSLALSHIAGVKSAFRFLNPIHQRPPGPECYTQAVGLGILPDECLFGKLGVRWHHRAVSPGLDPSLADHIGWKDADCDPSSMSELQPTKMQAGRQQEGL